MLFNHRLFILASIALFALKILLIVPIIPEGQTEKQSNLSSSVGLYRSTDFDVHRHWKAVTNKLPMHKWYKETGNSIWTLDYPPLFAFFEGFLSNVVHPLLKDKVFPSEEDRRRSSILIEVKIRGRHLFSVKSPVRAVKKLLADLFYDENLVKLGSPREEVTASMIRFMRSTVIAFGDIPLYIVLLVFFGNVEIESAWFALLLCAHPALIFIDNIHFQYNSMVFALFVTSIFAIDQQSPILGAMLYFVLLMFKHLFLCYAPAFGIWGLCMIVTAARKKGVVFGGVSMVVQFCSVLFVVVVLSLSPLVMREYEVLGREYLTDKEKALLMEGGPIPSSLDRFKKSTSTKNEPVSRFSSSPSKRFGEALKRSLSPMLERMFPFGRGLCHSYWAPNAYPLYNVADRYICKKVVKARGTVPTIIRATVSLFRRLVGQSDLQVIVSPTFCDDVSVNTRGLVHLSAATENSEASRQAKEKSQAPSHAVLPQITPATSAHLVLLGFFILAYSFFPAVVFILRKPVVPEEATSSENNKAKQSTNKKNQPQHQPQPQQDLPKFIRKLFAFSEHVSESGAVGLLKMCTASSLAFFLFGWHVHEKAILNVIFPIFILVALKMKNVDSRLLCSKIEFVHASILDFLNVNLMASIFVLPLLFTPKENIFKYSYLLAHHFCTKAIVESYVEPPRHPETNEVLPSRFSAKFTHFILWLMVLVSVWVDWKAGEMFLPLMVFSCMGSVALFGVVGGIRRIVYQ